MTIDEPIHGPRLTIRSYEPAEVAAENTASNALLRKFGFVVQKKSEFRKYNMDVRFDSCIYERRFP